MNSRLVLTIILFLGALTLFTTSSNAGSDPGPQDLHGKNPHGDSGDCSLCHVAPVEKLRGWFVFPATKRQLVADPTTLCQKCHGVSFGHGVGKKTHMNRSGLPLGANGTINCALTCHDMHISGVDDETQQRFHLRLPQSILCVSCHDK